MISIRGNLISIWYTEADFFIFKLMLNKKYFNIG